MAEAITVPQVRPVQPALRFLRVIPGVLLLAAVGYAGKLLEQNVGAYAKAHHWTFPNIEYVHCAIVLALSISIAAILALGALALFTFPVIGHFLHLSDKAYGLWAGLGVDNTAEATAAGALYSDAAGKLAVLVKSTRNAMIGFVVLGYAIYWASKGQAQAVGNKAAFLWQKFPKFVLGFLIISVLATYHFFNKDQVGALANLSRWAFLLTFAGVGLRTNFSEMRKQGLQPCSG